MKISFEVPKGFLGCGLTMIFKDDTGVQMYSTAITPDEVSGDKTMILPREEKLDDAQ